ncbi:flagellar export protein FliJ [bacterium]|nr:flagellar export protein FliJ [bacterium]
MPRFKFKLQRVLEIKEHREELLRNELAEANRVHQQERRALNELEENRERHFSEFSRAQAQEFLIISDLRIRLNFIKRLTGDLIGQSQKVREASKKVEDVRGELVKASQEKKVLESLKEKHYKGFLKEEESKEQHALDEIALSMYFRGASQLSLKK